MLLPTIIALMASTFPGLVRAVPAPAAIAVGATLTASGTKDGGFQIPKGATEGLYAVHFDDHGLSHHTKVADSTTMPGAIPQPRAAPVSTNSALQTRSILTGFNCPGYEMNHSEADICVENLAQACGADLHMIYPGRHLYSMSGNSAAFMCNYASDRHIVCDYNGIREAFSNIIPSACGHWMAGWADYDDPPWSIGQHWISSYECSNYFCGTNHC